MISLESINTDNITVIIIFFVRISVPNKCKLETRTCSYFTIKFAWLGHQSYHESFPLLEDRRRRYDGRSVKNLYVPSRNCPWDAMHMRNYGDEQEILDFSLLSRVLILRRTAYIPCSSTCVDRLCQPRLWWRISKNKFTSFTT